MIPPYPHHHDAQTQFFPLESDRFLRLSLDMVCIIGHDGYFQYLNHQWEEVLGFSKAELLAHLWTEFIHPDDQETAINHLHTLCSESISSTGHLTFETRYRCQDGSYKWFLWNAEFCPEQHTIYAVIRDITERN